MSSAGPTPVTNHPGQLDVSASQGRHTSVQAQLEVSCACRGDPKVRGGKGFNGGHGGPWRRQWGTGRKVVVTRLTHHSPLSQG